MESRVTISSVKLPNFIEGQVPFQVPAAGCKTWYKVSGDLESGISPLLVLHGGPGCAHEYLEIVSQLTTLHSIPIILYDQLGNGRSTHLQEKNGDTNNHDDYNVLGQSWGGMLAATFATQQPKGLNKFIADSPASMKLWVEVGAELRMKLPQNVQDTLNKHQPEGTTTHEEYLHATHTFYENLLCRVKPMSQALKAALDWVDKDPMVDGPKEFHITGSLKIWSIIDDLHKVSVPTLPLNGRYDEAQDKSVEPYFRNIPRVEWIQFGESAHVSHLEETERFMDIVESFLLEY
ncbi:hypothetical protein PAXRUDRAFT_29585 [Paxillus rubicundulus Ve08.2h10]|uniref:AB hydrolase-1 domain-containing protein n=1 Tax=Paxillus rubicundulus Ve08.2h10 TaxID=930991 RepID=A0A0D0DP22_9AGAM|nr:hypothetical protein PAXRUDRAFT_29585 [Paxillus rubicundulus Ve08.2h10]